ncbi:MAG: hypothetical protein FWF53_06915 [Candidatus Azobacteroides sp.]|nr:hypothetical protein [Candidatus Azobacteroides sp.]
MKKILIIAFTMFFISCSSGRFIYDSYSGVIDYSNYSTKGFFITESPSVSFEYTPIGSVIVEITSGYEIASSSKDKVILQWKYATYEDALQSLYKKAGDIKANGVIGLKYSYIPSISDKNYKKKVISPSKIIITGMAIKR